MPLSLVLSEPGALALARDYAAEGRARKLVDFEDHLNDLTRCAASCTLARTGHSAGVLTLARRARSDWLNPTLFA